MNTIYEIDTKAYRIINVTSRYYYDRLFNKCERGYTYNEMFMYSATGIIIILDGIRMDYAEFKLNAWYKNNSYFVDSIIQP